MSAVIARCVQAKADIVEQDERESGVRALLNLGHTFGHGIEKASHFEVHHGYAVAIGMVLMAQGAVKHGELDAEASDKLKSSHRSTRFANYYDHTKRRNPSSC